MKYRIYTKQGETRVKFKNGSDVCVHKNREGKEYFVIPNKKNKYFFRDQIKNAYSKIKRGEGDFMKMKDTGNIIVYKFVDKNYGKRVRQNSLKDFENIKFCYTLKFKIEDNIPEYLLKDGDTISALLLHEYEKTIKFMTKKEAKQYIKNKIKEGKKIKNKYEQLKTYNLEILLDNKTIQSVVHLIGCCLLFNIKFKFDIIQIIKDKDKYDKLFNNSL